LMEHHLFQSFQLLHAIFNTGINLLEYHMIKKQINQEELNVFKKWQERKYAITKKAKNNKNEEPNGIIIPDSNNGLLTIVSDKPKRKYVRKDENTNN